MLGNHGIRQGCVARRHPEALLQARQGKGLAVLCLLQKSEHQLKRGNPHCHIERLDHQPCSGVTITSGEQVLPEVPPVLVREEVALVAAMEQGPRLGAQAIDQVLQVNAPSPGAMAATAINTGQLTDPVAAEVDDQPVMVQPHCDLVAHQARRYGVDDLPHLDRAAAPHPHREQLIVSKAKGGQGGQLFELLLVAPLPGGIEGAEHLSEQLAVFGGFLDITAAA